MSAYWSQIITQLSTQRARWISQLSSKPGSPSEQETSSSSSERPMDQQPSPKTASGNSIPLARENALLKLEIAALSEEIGQMSKILDSRAAQIQVLVDCTRHLRLQQRRMASLSSMDGVLEVELCEDLWLLSVDDVGSSASSSCTSCSEDEHELSAFFDGWSESDGEEKHEEAALVESTGRPLGRSVSTPSTEKEQHHVEPRSQSFA